MSKLGRALDAVGGSDIAAIRGKDDRGDDLRQTPRDIWERIVNGREKPQAYNLLAELGNAAEETICNDYCIRHNISRTSVERTVEVFLSDAEPYFRGELDMYVPPTNHSVDSKFVIMPPSARKFDEGSVSDYILNQQVWYNIVGNLDYSVVCAVIFGTPTERIVPRLPEFEALVLEDVRRFWTDYVMTGKRPPALTTADVLIDHPVHTAPMDKATEAELALVDNVRSLKESYTALDKRLDAAKAALCEAIGPREGLWLGGDDRVTFKADKNGKRSLKV
jgi:hypothetical protein